MLRGFLIGLILVSFMVSAKNTVEDYKEESGRYQLVTAVYQNKKGTFYVVETVLDTKTGKIVKRAKKKASSYKLPYKGRGGRTVYED